MLIKASFSQEVSTSGGSMVYIPEGVHTITPTVNGKPKEITVRVKAHKGEEIAQRLQASFEKRQKENPVRAIFDFGHNGVGAAAALPKRFFYEKGKGIMVERELTGPGSKAIKAKDYSYFSPEFHIGKDGIPSGLPQRGPLGALVNDPAFRDIPCIAASHAVTKTTITMDELSNCGLLTASEAAKQNESASGEHEFIVKARAMVKEGSAKTPVEAMSAIASQNSGGERGQPFNFEFYRGYASREKGSIRLY